MKISVYRFPWSCYKCNGKMQVTYPMTEDVYNSEYRGNLAPVETVFVDYNFGNICPICGAYQGVHYVWMAYANEFSYDLEKYFVGKLEIEKNCILCGKPLEDDETEELKMEMDTDEDSSNLGIIEDKEDTAFFSEDIKPEIDLSRVCKMCFNADLQDYAKPVTPEYDLTNSILETVALPENLTATINVDKSFKLKSDHTVIKRILTNLVTNAVQAMPKGGKLTVSATEDQNKVTLSVEDTGMGIPEEFKSNLFKPMKTTKAKGQGLGLVVVKKFVDALEGTIKFNSEIGKGTKFSISLPKP